MADLSPPRRTGCGCESFRPGHNCHVTQARLANSDPESWFVATVTEANGDEVVIAYDDGTTCRLWRHGGFDRRAALGARVLTCEVWSVMSVVDGAARERVPNNGIVERHGDRRAAAVSLGAMDQDNLALRIPPGE